MRKRSLILIIFGALSTLVGNSPDLLSQSFSAGIRAIDTVDICSMNTSGGKEVALIIDIGSIKQKDSLFGFNYEISYNPEKVKFIQPLYINTLSEGFEARDMSIDSKKGIVRGFAMTMSFTNPPSSGNLPLIGFLVEAKSECADTSLVNLNSLEFTDEFKKTYDAFYPATVATKVFDKSSRGAEVKLEVDTVTTTGRRLVGKVIIDKNAKIENLKALFSLSDTSFFKFSNIFAIGETEESEFEIKADTAIVTFKLSYNKDNLIYIDLDKQQKYTGVTSVTSNVLLQSSCDCAIKDQFRSNTLELPKDSADTTVSGIIETDKNDIKYGFSNGNIYIRNKGAISASIENINGKRVKEAVMTEREIYLRIDDLPDGTYFLRMQTETYDQKRIILLISNKQVFFN